MKQIIRWWRHRMTSANNARVATLVFGAIAVGVGVFSHFQSYWLKGSTPGDNHLHPYQACEDSDYREVVENLGYNCPRIAMERFFVYSLMACFAISFALLIAALVMDNDRYKIYDGIYHILAGVVLMTAGMLYVISAQQIEKMRDLVERYFGREMGELYREQKLAAGVITAINGFVYVGASTVILRIDSVSIEI